MRSASARPERTDRRADQNGADIDADAHLARSNAASSPFCVPLITPES
jgi:hypothetical protein